MVAASKLRRAQAAAEAARPYAERMDTVLRQHRRRRRRRRSARRSCWPAPASDQVHLLVVCTAERGLCGAFNSSIVRLAREHVNALHAEGKEVKILCVGRKGADQLRRALRQADRRSRRSARRAQLGFANADDDRAEDHGAVRAGEFDVCDAVLLALQVGDRADPDRAADHPAGVRAGEGRRRRRARLRIRAGGRGDPRRSAAAQHRDRRFSARCWKTPPRSTARR